jgi:hypothetical protein
MYSTVRLFSPLCFFFPVEFANGGALQVGQLRPAECGYKMLADHALVLLVGVAADGALNIRKPRLEVRSDPQVGRACGKDPAIRVGHGRTQLAPTLGLGLGRNPMALAVGAEECAHKADDLTGLVPAWRYRPLTVAAFSLFSRHLTLLLSLLRFHERYEPL